MVATPPSLPLPLPNDTDAPLLDVPTLDSNNSADAKASTTTSEDDDGGDDAGTVANGKVKCGVKNCPGLSHKRMICAVEGCSKSCHRLCYNVMVSRSKKALTPYVDKVFVPLGIIMTIQRKIAMLNIRGPMMGRMGEMIPIIQSFASSTF